MCFTPLGITGRLSIAVGGLLMLTTLIAEKKDPPVGPYCWAGADDGGNAVFIPCHQSPTRQITEVDLDLASLSKLRIHTGGEIITVSREQILKALAEWRGAGRANP